VVRAAACASFSRRLTFPTRPTLALAASGAAPSRFCQKCYKWHPLCEYDGEKHTCRAQLGKQSAWRRAQSAARAAAAAASGLAARLTAPRGNASGTTSTEEARRLSPEVESSAHWLSWLQDEAGAATPLTELPADDGVLQLKFPDLFPDELPSNARDAIAAAFPPAAFPPAAGYIEPGCTLLRVEPALPPLPGAARCDSAAVAAALLNGPAKEWFARQRWDLCCGGVAVRHAPGAAAASQLVRPAVRPGAPPPTPRALCTAAASSLSLPVPRGWTPRLRFHGAFLGADVTRRHGGGINDVVMLALPPCPDLEGVALLELVPDNGNTAAQLCVAPPPRAVLLTPSYAVAAELTTMLRGDSSDSADVLLRGFGAALRPSCPPQLAAAAAADAARHSWPATLARLTEAMRRRVEADTATGGVYSSPGALLAPDGHTSLLHVAVRACSPRCVAVLLPRRGSNAFLFGAPDEADATAATPLHFAAALPSSPAARAVLDALLRAGGQHAEHAWEEASDSSGRTPAALAAASAAAMATSDAAFEVHHARASLPHMRIIVALLWLYCVAACVRAFVDAPPDPAAVRAVLLAHGGRLHWADLRPLLRGRRYLARLPLVGAATALVAGGTRLNAVYVAHARTVVAVLAAFFFVAEGAASALAARAWLLADGHLQGAPLGMRWGWAADAPPALRVLWPGQLAAAECALSALVTVLPLRCRDALVLLAARAVVLPTAAQALRLPVWHALADARWCVAHVVVAAGAAALVHRRASAARAAWDARCREQALKAA